MNTMNNLSKYESEMVIRNETAANFEAITEVTIAAFRTLPISNHTEQFIIRALRSADAPIISLVAEIDEHIVGHKLTIPLLVFLAIFYLASLFCLKGDYYV
jgi:putative acetyltransferase